MFTSAPRQGNKNLTGAQPGIYSQSAQRPQKKGQKAQQSFPWLSAVVSVGSAVVAGGISYVVYSVLGNHPVVKETVEKCGFTAERIVECGCNIGASCAAILGCMEKCNN